MPYYVAGDYYGRGDYYRGDPGLFGSIGKFLGGAVKVGAGFLTGGPTKAISTAVSLVAPKRAQVPMIASPVPPPTAVSGFGAGVFLPGGGGIGVGRFAQPGSVMPPPAMIPSFGGKNGGRPGHFRKDGSWTDRARPRLNVLNMRALRRANRRARGFLKAARSAVRYFTPRAPKGKAYVSFKRKAK